MLEGQSKFTARLRRLAAQAEKMGQVVYAAGDMIRVEARQSITRGAVSGKGHVPSKPGEPPKADTHHLDSNITTERKGPLTVEVRSKAEYSAALEYGTSKMAARPFMRPAVKRVQPKLKGFIAVQVKRMVQES
jgi:HK97 gp10 family phage protein